MEKIMLKVRAKQHNSRMCVICGLDNEYGVKAPFYSMEDGSVMTVFSFKPEHQSYPGRVHGGVISAMLDEMGLRALWAKEQNEDSFGVTMTLDTKYRKPVPYDQKILGRGEIVKDTGRFFVTHASVMDLEGNVLAEADVKYIRLDVNAIAEGFDSHDEMPYLVEDGVTEIDYTPAK